MQKLSLIETGMPDNRLEAEVDEVEDDEEEDDEEDTDKEDSLPLAANCRKDTATSLKSATSSLEDSRLVNRFNRSSILQRCKASSTSSLVEDKRLDKP